MKPPVAVPEQPHPQIDLRTGAPYAKLIRSQARFASVVAAHFGVDAETVIPTAGATGAIEAVRNHAFQLSGKTNPVLLTVSPGYWRARESFQGLGFLVADVQTEADGFQINETALIEKAAEVRPDIVYLSLPNNPTGAVFDPEKLLHGLSDGLPIVFDLTLPSRQLNTQELAGRLYYHFRGRRKLFLVGSTSKSHNTAELRIGWAICANDEDARQLKRENRNIVSSMSVEIASTQLPRESPVHDAIEKSFRLLKSAEAHAGFKLIEPPARAQSSYLLVRFSGDSRALRSLLEQHGIAVMWGSEFGLADHYVRLEASEPKSIQLLIGALTDLRKRQSA
jgi:aspartate/methionine/tyrosine aminotransferase